MNRRRHPRLDLEIPAIIRYQGEDHDACRLLNFSRGGAFLQCLDESLKDRLAEGYFAENERQEALLTVPAESLQVKVHLVYFHNNGLGLAFCDAAGARLFESLYARLQARDSGQPQKGNQEGIDSDVRRRLLAQLQTCATDFLKQGLPLFIDATRQVLQHQIVESADSQEESALFYALNSLEQDREALIRDFLDRVGRGFAELLGEAPEAPLEEGDETELALVEKQEIDTWILVNEAARHVESEVSRSLYQFEIALSYLCQANIHNELDPLSPISLLTALKGALDDYELEVETIRLVVYAFRKSLLSELGTLYTQLMGLLRQQGIGKLEQRLHDSWTIINSPSTQPPVGAAGHLTALANLHASADERTALQGMPMADRDTVLASLSSLSSLQGASLQQQIEKLLLQETAQPLKLSPEARMAIGAGEELVAELGRDPLITSELRALLGSLKFLIIEAVLNDTSLLENPQHPVRRLLDAIDALKPYVNSGPNVALIRDRDTSRLAGITEAVESSRLEHVDQVTREIQCLQQEQRERFEKNRRLAISRCLRDEKLRQAERRTYDALASLLRDRALPLAVDRLLRMGWVKLLVQKAAQEGSQGKNWQAYLAVVEWLVDLFVDESSPGKIGSDRRQALLTRVADGFSDYPVHPEDARRFEHDLRQTLSGTAIGEAEPLRQRVEIDGDYLAGFFRDLSEPGMTETAVDPVWQARVAELALDSWLIEATETGAMRVLSLAWKHPAAQRYLLVDGDGFTALDADLPQLAARFAAGKIKPWEQSVQPLVERTIETILSNSYDGFKQESSVDLLTGLANRRAFEMELRKQLDEQAGAQVSHTLLLIDLDKFQVVNDLCGFEGGDRLLQTVTDILLSYLPQGGFLARIGDDEFALLLRNHDIERGYETAESLRLAIDDYAFEWQDRLIPSSASVGLVELAFGEQIPGKLMQAALAACNMAKHAGGNCTRIYLASDSAYQDQQQLVQSLPAIKEALAKGRMALFVQPIVPLREAQELSLHHEVLLRIRNAAGELEPPQEFVRAAEQFDLMRAVDRWVVEAFFELVEPYAEKLPPGHSFSINLSGKSVGDGEFKRFLMERIATSRLHTCHLGFEITETALVGDISDTAAFIEAVREQGCSFSLDDFGSGYASFSYLKDFPVDFVKIDGVFVREILNKPADYAMINSITEIAHFMDKRVIAEFVSDQEICEALKGVGVDYGQGYHFGRPRPLQEMLAEIEGQQGAQRSGSA